MLKTTKIIGKLIPHRHAAALVALALAIGAYSPAHARNLQDEASAVVKIYATQQHWDIRQPWTKSAASRVTCSGSIIDRGILTNAHCIVQATFIEVEMQGAPKKIPAEIVAVNHQIDLALIKLSEPLPDDVDIESIEFGKLPDHREKVVTIGYPTGGRQISYTEGIVSRIDIMRYAHSGMSSLMVQTDAAINPGNSGGPVFSDSTGRCLGVATQINRDGENLGYFIPVPMIDQFFADLDDDKIDGIPNLGVGFQNLENDSLRKKLGLGPEQSGVRIRNIARGSSADGVLEVDDVLYKIEDRQIYNDGQVKFLDSSKISFGYYIYPHAVGDKIEITIVRGGEEKEIELELKPYIYSVIPPIPEYDRQPRYILSGGLLFLAVEPRYLWRWRDMRKLPASLKNYLSVPLGEEDLEELVIISEIFEAELNKGYGSEGTNVRVMNVNGKPIVSLENLREVLEQTNGAQFLEVELENDVKIVLDRELMKSSEPAIKKIYNIKE